MDLSRGLCYLDTLNEHHLQLGESATRGDNEQGVAGEMRGLRAAGSKEGTADTEPQRLLEDLHDLKEQLAAARSSLSATETRLEDKSQAVFQCIQDIDRRTLKRGLLLDREGRVEAAVCAGGQPLEDDRLYEWLRMLQADEPTNAGLMVIEAECDHWEGQLHEHLLGQRKRNREGLERLDAELQDLTLEERRTSSCAKCLEVLERDHPNQAISHLRKAYTELEAFRRSNDQLAAQKAKLRWQKLVEADGRDQAASPTKSMKVEERYLPPGPKFFSMAQLLQAAEEPPDENPHMPQAVVTRSKWFSPLQERGLSFLPSLMSQRLQPSETGSLSWGRPVNYSFEPSVFSTDFEASISRTPTNVEVLRKAFQEPLSEVLGAQPRPRQVPPSLEPKQRGWVTFDLPSPSPVLSESPEPGPGHWSKDNVWAEAWPRQPDEFGSSWDEWPGD